MWRNTAQMQWKRFVHKWFHFHQNLTEKITNTRHVTVCSNNCGLSQPWNVVFFSAVVALNST